MVLADLDLKGRGNMALSPLSAPSSFRAQNLSCHGPACTSGIFVQHSFVTGGRHHDCERDSGEEDEWLQEAGIRLRLHHFRLD